MGVEETHHLLPQQLLSLVYRHLWDKDLAVFHLGTSTLSEMRVLHCSGLLYTEQGMVSGQHFSQT